LADASKAQPAPNDAAGDSRDEVRACALFDTTLPMDLSRLTEMDSGRYHSVWLPDHYVSFWPETIWTPEFTDLATVSPSPHRQLDSIPIASAAGLLTSQMEIGTFVVDTVRRHPAMLAQTALTLDHVTKGRFLLGLGSGELENVVPYGFDFEKPVSRFEESIEVIKLLWHSDGPVNFEGDFYKLEHARLDTEFYGGRPPPIWIGANGPRMLGITGRHADGWWPFGMCTPESYADKVRTIREAAEKVDRDPFSIMPGLSQICLIGEEDEIEEILQAPLVKIMVLTVSAENARVFGHEHPMGPDWRGLMDFNPVNLPRDKIIQYCAEMDTQIIRDLIPVGTVKQVALKIKGLIDAGCRLFMILDYGALAGLKYAMKSAEKIRQVEDEVLRLVKGA
jgi:phthiodiolone/phenolphthiodiolone dimycocerosates ketoreductase